MLATDVTKEFLTSFETSENSTQKNMAEIKEWIRINYANHISVQKVAWNFNYNQNYLSTIFKKYTGSSLLTYINKTRINAAKKMLLDTSLPIKTISARSGFNDEKNFMKTFKRIQGITPTQYRTTFYRKHMNKQ